MYKKIIIAFFILFSSVLILSNPAFSASKKQNISKPQLVITKVFVNFLDQVILIEGRNFDNGGEPVVTLGSLNLDLNWYDDSHIEVALPQYVENVDYLLTVTTGNAVKNYDAYDLTISPLSLPGVGSELDLSAGTQAGQLLQWNGGYWTHTDGYTDGTADNMQPYLALRYIIALQGAYPSQSSTSTGPFVGEIRTVSWATTWAPMGWHFCDGTVLNIYDYQALFSLLGCTYGGNCTTTFALPDLRGRVPVNAGTGTDLTGREIGQKGGSETSNIFSIPQSQ